MLPDALLMSTSLFLPCYVMSVEDLRIQNCVYVNTAFPFVALARTLTVRLGGRSPHDVTVIATRMSGTMTWKA